MNGLRLALSSVLVTSASLSPGQSVARDGGSAPSFTVVPPGPVTDQIKIELRLALGNPSQAPRKVTVRFYWDQVAPEHLTYEQSHEILPGNTALVTSWCTTAGKSGPRDLRFTATDDDGRTEEGRWPLEVIPCETRALPMLVGAWCDPGVLCPGSGYPARRPPVEQDVRDQVDAMKQIGVTTVVVTYVEMENVGVFYPSQIAELGKHVFDFDVVEAVLAQADLHGMHVFLGLGRGDDLLLLWDGLEDAARIAKGIDLGRRVASELWQRYRHHASFYGWYFTHEMNDLEKASAYYDPLAEHCHGLSPDRPVIVAPSGSPILSTEILRRSQVDIFAYQDAVGPGYKDYRYTLDPEIRLADLEAVYTRFRDLHRDAGKHLWTDLEIWRANHETGYTPFLPAPMEQVERQIRIEARHVEMITGYEFLSMMERPGSGLGLGGPKAEKLYRAYEAYYRGQQRRR